MQTLQIPNHYISAKGKNVIVIGGGPLGAALALALRASGITVAAMEAREPDNPALPKYAEIGRRFAMQKGLNGKDARAFLVLAQRARAPSRPSVQEHQLAMCVLVQPVEVQPLSRITDGRF